MVMDASPSPQSVGREFVRQYYTLLNKAPAHLHRFYNNQSSFVHGGLDPPNRESPLVIGQKQIHNQIQQLNFRDCHAKISQVDAQATLGNGVVVQVTGELSNGGAPMRRFTQTFVLGAQSPKKYYVHNDIFRYQDIVFSDEEGEGSVRSEGEEDDNGVGVNTTGYFPPPPTAFPPPTFPAPPHAMISPTAPPVIPTQPAHINGHPAQPTHEESTRHLVAALQGTVLSSGINEHDLEPEPVSVAPNTDRPVPTGVAVINASATNALVNAVAMPTPSANSMGTSVNMGTTNAMGSATSIGANAVAAVTPAAGEPAPEPQLEREEESTPPPAQPAAPPAPAEPKTYANLLKSGSSMGSAAPVSVSRGSPPAQYAAAPVQQVSAPAAPSVAAPPLAPAEQRPRSQRAPRDTQTAGQYKPRPNGVKRDGRAPTGGAGNRYSDSQQLFLGNLPHSATEEELRVVFERFGPVAELRVHSKPAAPGAPRHPNYGFITYETAQAAHECLNAATQLYFPADSPDGVKLNVEEKKARGREPPRRRPLSGHRNNTGNFQSRNNNYRR